MYSTVTAPPTINEAVLAEALNAVSSGSQGNVIGKSCGAIGILDAVFPRVARTSGHVQDHPDDDAGVVGIVAAEVGRLPDSLAWCRGAHGFSAGPPSTPEGIPVAPSTPEADVDGADGYVCAVRGCNKKPWPESGRCTAHGGEPTPPSQSEEAARHRKEETISIGKTGWSGCTNVAQARGICLKHGANQLKKKKKPLPCKVEGCTSVRHGGNFCLRHGGGAKCRHPGCGQPCRHPTPLCHAHGAMPSSYTACDVPGCGRRCLVVAGGRCHDHGGYTAVGMCQDLNCFKLAKKPSIYCGTHGTVPQCHGSSSCRRRPVGNTGLCRAHGGQPEPATCSTPGCSNLALPSGPGGQRVCPIHWDGVTTLVQRCSHLMCQRPAREYGLCVAHGGGRSQCSVPGCIQPVANRRVSGDTTLPDKCRMHLGPEYSRRCIVKGCMKARMLSDDSAGMCAKHHMESMQGEAAASKFRWQCGAAECAQWKAAISKFHPPLALGNAVDMTCAEQEGDLVVASNAMASNEASIGINHSHAAIEDGNATASERDATAAVDNVVSPDTQREESVEARKAPPSGQQQPLGSIGESSLVIPPVESSHVSSTPFFSSAGPSNVFTDEQRAAEAVAAVVVMEMEAERQQLGGGGEETASIPQEGPPQ
ncbi:hypothetical protein FOZ60_000877 [Perkinsus olseni]|uniref:WRKY transcription factor 19 n=1 Tax=Perkinsus olseni TaxID=32597 RepID=A0A7J6PLG4_PEROL|nr:hypothetical protein FOZ60_000877 [Perkinsus olseni]